MSRRPSFIVLGLGVALAYGVRGETAATAHEQHAAPAPQAAGSLPGLPGIGGPFDLVDQHGRRRTSDDFAGKFLLVTFGFTDCPDVCPLDLQKVSTALDLVGPAIADRVVPLFITVNPERDTPARLAAFVGAFHPSIVGLTGSMTEIGRVVRAYRVHVRYSPDRDPAKVSHSDFQYLMAPGGGLSSLVLPAVSAEELAERLRKYAN